MIRFEKITGDNWRECNRLKVAENQRKFVAENVTTLARAYVFQGKANLGFEQTEDGDEEEIVMVLNI